MAKSLLLKHARYLGE